MIVYHCVSETDGQDKVHLRWEIEEKPTTGGRSASAAPQSHLQWSEMGTGPRRCVPHYCRSNSDCTGGAGCDVCWAGLCGN